MKITNFNFGTAVEGANEVKKIVFLIVDDEEMIRRSVMRLLLKYSKDKNLEFLIIEAKDGVEMITAIYLSQKRNIKVDIIISDESMKFMNGSLSSNIMERLCLGNIIRDIPIFISTAYGNGIDKNKFSKSVKKIYSKPIDLNIMREIISSYNR